MVTENLALSGRSAVVTGGGRGIGLAIAEALARQGADLTIMGRDQRILDQAAAGLAARFGVRVQAIVCDVGRADSIAMAFQEAAAGLGSPYILVNNAGIAEGAPFLNAEPQAWTRHLDVNLTGPYLCIRQVLGTMLQAEEGRIVNIASTAGLKGYSHTAAYVASKHGLIGLTRALAQETARSGVTVNAVCPGYTDTAMAQRAADNLVRERGKTPDEARALLSRSNPAGRLIQPNEVANVVAWLCSAEAGAITGQALVVAGGEVA